MSAPYPKMEASARFPAAVTATLPMMQTRHGRNLPLVARTAGERDAERAGQDGERQGRARKSRKGACQPPPGNPGTILVAQM